MDWIYEAQRRALLNIVMNKMLRSSAVAKWLLASQELGPMVLACKLWSLSPASCQSLLLDPHSLLSILQSLSLWYPWSVDIISTEYCPHQSPYLAVFVLRLDHWITWCRPGDTLDCGFSADYLSVQSMHVEYLMLVVNSHTVKLSLCLNECHIMKIYGWDV
jgi:hypothetical protein